MNCQKIIVSITYMKRSNDENLKAFGKIVRKIRKKKSSSLNSIAFEKGGVTSATLSRIENGLVDFKFSTLINLSHTLGVSLDELFKDYKFKTKIDE